MASLSDLYRHYRAKVRVDDKREALRELRSNYMTSKTDSLVDAGAAGVALASILGGSSFDESALTPQMNEAFELAFPNLQLDTLTGKAADELAGLLSAWKGKLFEVAVRDRLNAGEWVGDLHLDPGQTAALADSPTQTGWDLQIIGEDGGVVDQLQLKASESLSYVKEALEKYPDIDVLATEEIDAEFPEGVEVADIADADLTDVLADAVSDGLGESVLDAVLPGLPLLLIGVTEGLGVLSGKRTASDAVRRALSRGVKNAAAGGLGIVAGFLLGPIVGIGVAIVSRLLMGGESKMAKPTVPAKPPDYSRMSRTLERLLVVGRALVPRYST